jgi:DNA invertase Pin-like site-specific DNA recombinase
VAEERLRVQTRLNTPDRAKLLEAYACGTPVREIAATFGVHRATINRIVSESDVPLRNCKLSPSEQEKARKLFESGLSLVKVAEAMDISRTGARKAILAAGGTMRPTERNIGHAGHSLQS